jgi:predicted NBD/HSP70 family sugar kinase
MSAPKGGSGSALGAGALLEVIRERPRTRAELLESTGLSRSTLVQRLELLVGHDLVRTDQTEASTGGRPAAILSFNEAAGLVFVADVDTRSHLALMDLGGRVVAETFEPADVAEGPGPVLALLEAKYHELLAQAGRTRADVRAVGIGVPGPVEFAEGWLVRPHSMPGWDHFPVSATLGARLGVPVLVDNEVNLMAIGEHATAWPQVPNLVFVKIGTGIGSGIIAGGRIYRGSQGSAGDIGHIAVPGYEDRVCICGNYGCLGAIASGMSLAAQLTERGVPTADAAEFAMHVQQGIPQAIQLVRGAGRAVGRVLASMVNILNPSALIIGGPLAGAGEYLLAGIREEIYARGTALATHPLQIAVSTAGDRAGITGAGVMAIDHVVSPEAVDRALAA